MKRKASRLAKKGLMALRQAKGLTEKKWHFYLFNKKGTYQRKF